MATVAVPQDTLPHEYGCLDPHNLKPHKFFISTFNPMRFRACLNVIFLCWFCWFLSDRTVVAGYNRAEYHQRVVRFNIKTIFLGIRITIIKKMRSHDRLTFIMGMLVRRHLILEQSLIIHCNIGTVMIDAAWPIMVSIFIFRQTKM